MDVILCRVILSLNIEEYKAVMMSHTLYQSASGNKEMLHSQGSLLRLYHVKIEAMVNLIFYFKEGCWLCDKAEEMLNGLKVKYDIRVVKVAIDSDDELYELYRFDIPVFEFKDGSTLYGDIKKKDLLRKLDENKEEK